MVSHSGVAILEGGQRGKLSQGSKFFWGASVVVGRKYIEKHFKVLVYEF